MTSTTITPAQGDDDHTGSLVFLSISEHVVRAHLAALRTDSGLTRGEELPDAVGAEEAFTIACVSNVVEHTITEGATGEPSSTDGEDPRPTRVRVCLEAVDPGWDEPSTIKVKRDYPPGVNGDTSLKAVAELWLASDTQYGNYIATRTTNAFADLNADERRLVSTHLEQVRANFDVACGLLSPDAAMEVCGQMLACAGGVSLTPIPGVFFVPHRSHIALAAIRQFVETITNDPRNSYVAVERVYASHDLKALIDQAIGTAVADAGTPVADWDPIPPAQPGQDVIGHIVLHIVPERPLPSTAREILAQFDVAEGVRLPDLTTSREAFHKACSPGVRAEHDLDGDTKVRFEIAYGGDTMTFATYRLTRHCITPTETTAIVPASLWLTATSTGETNPNFHFDIHYNNMAISALPAAERLLVNDVLTEVRTAYKASAEAFPPSAFQWIVDQLLSKAGAVQVSAHVAFVPPAGAAVLRSTARLVRALAGERGDTHFVVLPVVRKTNIAQVVTAATRHCVDRRIRRVETEVHEVTVSEVEATEPQVVTRLTTLTDELTARITPYADVLPADAQDEFNQRIQQLRTTIAAHRPTPPAADHQ